MSMESSSQDNQQNSLAVTEEIGHCLFTKVKSVFFSPEKSGASYPYFLDSLIKTSNLGAN